MSIEQDREEQRILSLSDEEVIQEIRRRGEDPDKIVRRMKEIVRKAIYKFRGEHD